MGSSKVALVVSTYNRPGGLAKVLAGLGQQSRIPNEIIIADDGSTEVTRKVVSRWESTSGFSVKHLWQPDEGFRAAKIRNEGIRNSKADYFIFLDGDCVPHPRFVEDHIQLSEENIWVQGRRAFVEQKYVPAYFPGVTNFMKWWILGRTSGLAKGVRWPGVFWGRTDQEIPRIISCNMGIWARDLERVNGFDESYEGWGLEDTDLGIRLYKAGLRRKIVYGRAVIHHLNHPESPRHQLSSNLSKLDQTIQREIIRCQKGLVDESD